MAMKMNLRIPTNSGRLLMSHTPPKNRPPVTTGTVLNSRTYNTSTVISFGAAAAFSDPDGDTLTYSATGLPTGLTLSPSTGIVTGTIPDSAGSIAGIPYLVTITATDPGGKSVSESFTITATSPAFIPYSGSWATNFGGVVSNNGRTLDQFGTTTFNQPWGSAVTSGKIYLEITITKSSKASSGSPLPMVGWGDVQGATFFTGTGVNWNTFWYAPARVYFAAGTAAETQISAGVNLPTYVIGQTIMLAKDVATGKYWYGVNGTWSNGATSADIAAGNKALYINTSKALPWLIVGNGAGASGSCVFEVNQGQKAYLFTKPTGFTPMGSPTSS